MKPGTGVFIEIRGKKVAVDDIICYIEKFL
jgi:hypothetical protein